MPKINVLFISDNFVPETNAAATRVYERAQYWNEWDINCQVITSFPNRYKGKNHPGYSDRFFKKEIIGGISTVRVKTFISASPSFFLRALHQLSFTINAFFAGLFKRHIDVIIVTTPQFFCTLTGLLLSKLKRVPYIIEIADIWSDSIKGTLLTESFLYRLLRGFETWMLNQSDSLIVLTKGFKDEIIKRGISERKISVSRNGVNEISLPDEKLVQKYREELGLKEKKVLGYMGAHGAAQGLDNLIESAKILEFSNPEIIFVFIGDGDEKKELMRLSKPSKNIIFLNAIEKYEVPTFLSLFDIGVAHLKNDSIFKHTIPSKIFELVSAGLPVLLVSPKGEAAEIIEENELGYWVRSGRSEDLAKKIITMINDEDSLARFSKNAAIKTYKFSRRKQAQEMAKVIESLHL